MDSKDLLTLALQRADQLQTYWSFYATVVLAVLAFFGSIKFEQRTVMLATFVSIAFLAVSIANLEALRDVTRQRLVVQEGLLNLGRDNPQMSSLISTIAPSSLFAVTGFHLLFDAFTLVAIWALALSPPASEAAEPTTVSR